MIAIDSKSYPYLAVAQATGLSYDEVLKWSIEEVVEKQQNIKKLRASLGIDYDKVKNVYGIEIWNAAIEKAALELRMCTTGNWVELILERIRALKI